MKKIIIVFNGVDYPHHLLNYIFSLTEVSPALLHAVFMKPMHVDESLQYPFPNDLSQTQDSISKADEEWADIKAIEANRQVFKDECVLKGIHYTIDERIEISINELVAYSKFSDAIIADSNTTLGKYAIKDLLSDAHCPVILVQRNSLMPQKVVLTFDGSLSSIFAIKMYAYLFPELKDIETFLLLIEDDPQGERNDLNFFNEWLTKHFPLININVQKGKIKEELVSFIANTSDKTLVVMGAFGRKGLAAFFHKSLSSVVIEESHASLFIAHQ